jgi:hypothetical protein
MAGIRDEALAGLLQCQDSVVARWQISDPATISRIYRRLDAGRWQSPHPGVYVGQTGPLTRTQQLWVALLACGPGAALSRETAAELAGLGGFESQKIHVTMPRNRSGPRPAGVQPHRAKLIAPFVHPARAPRRFRVDHAALEVAAFAPADDRAHAVIAATVQQGLSTVAMLRDAVDQRPRLPRRALILESLLDIEGGAQSINEIAMLRLVRRAGLPLPKLQVRVATERRGAYIDGGWPDYDVWFEIDGELHREAARWADDLDRGNELAIEHGGTRLRWSGFVVRRRPERVVDQAARALRRRGWAGLVRPA